MKLLREPVVHFIVLGAVLAFVLSESDPPPAPIIIDHAFVEGLHEDHVRRTGTSDVNDNALMETWIRDEVMYRRAVDLGLDRGDAIVRRRLIQKMRLILEASVDIPDASDEELRTFLDETGATYRRPARIAFEHRYFSRDRRASPAEDASAARVLLLEGGEIDTDPFLLGATRPLTSQAAIGRRFGASFAEAVAALPLNAWSEPIESRYGVHLVRVSEHEEGSTPDVASIRSELQHAWRQSQRAAHVERAIAELVEQADVVRPDLDAQQETREDEDP